MPKKNWLNTFRIKIQAHWTDFALIVIAITQVPIALKNAAALGQTSTSFGNQIKLRQRQICLQFKYVMEGSNLGLDLKNQDDERWIIKTFL
tara:strand:- start:653 stop:925 length:273 start_codon:yes stop_codon:yes gene_type:complete